MKKLTTIFFLFTLPILFFSQSMVMYEQFDSEGGSYGTYSAFGNQTNLITFTHDTVGSWGSVYLSRQGVFSSGSMVCYDSFASVFWTKEVYSEKPVNINGVEFIKGNYIVYGTFYDKIQVDDLFVFAPNSWLNFFVIKLDEQGNIIHASTVANSGRSNLNDVVYDEFNDKIYFSGSFVDSLQIGSVKVVSNSGSAFLAQLDINLMCDWINFSSGNEEDGRQIAIGENGSIYWVALKGSDTELNGVPFTSSYSGHGSFVSKVNQDGDFEWVKNIEATIEAHAFCVEYIQGNLFVGGELNGDLFLDQNLELSSESQFDGFLLKFDSYGDLYDSELISGNDNNEVHDFEIDKQGNLFVLCEIGEETSYKNESIEVFGLNEPLMLRLDIENMNLINTFNIRGASRGVVQYSSISKKDSLYILGGVNRSGLDFNGSLINAPNNKESFMILISDDHSYTTSVKEEELKGVFYPNPFVNELNVETNGMISDLLLYNSLGEKVYEYKDVNLFSTVLKLDEDLSGGVYYLKVIFTDSRVVTKRLMKY